MRQRGMRSCSFKEQQQGCLLSGQLPLERQEELQPACWSMGSRADFQPLEAADPEAETPGGLTLSSLGHCAFLFGDSWHLLEATDARALHALKCNKDY